GRQVALYPRHVERGRTAHTSGRAARRSDTAPAGAKEVACPCGRRNCMGTSKRIGVIGVGFGAQVYVPGLQSEGWDVVALCSRTRDKAVPGAGGAGVRDGAA